MSFIAICPIAMQQIEKKAIVGPNVYGGSPRSLKRRTLELSMLDEVIQMKVEELLHQEEKLKRMSAPIVHMDELDHLLIEI